ncbi:MAG: hypothetical protein N7Q72_00270 [Spiroplasma sp. Tabriz.8]|nr:hypothetical protein [Spiroplasma sp. Tabriz.8]
MWCFIFKFSKYIYIYIYIYTGRTCLWMAPEKHKIWLLNIIYIKIIKIK